MTALTTQAHASLFVTCIVDQLYPEVGESVVRVLERFGVELEFPQDQTCCGQPAFNSGFWSDALPLAKRVITTFRGAGPIVVPSGSCASMIRVFYRELLHDEPELLAEAKMLAPRVYELSEFIVDFLKIKDLRPYINKQKPISHPKVTYHEACHLRRELGVITQPRALINLMPDVELIEMEQQDVCCGFGGTFSVKFPDISAAILQDKIDHIRETSADTLVSCDSSCLMQIASGMDKQGVGVRSIHLAQLIDEALGSP